MKIKQKLLNLAWVFLDLVSLLSQAPWYNTPPRNSELPLYLLPSLLLNAVIFLVAVLCPFFFCLVYSPHVSYDLLPCMLSTQLCPTLCDPINCSPPRLLCPWNFPGKNTGMCCHFLLQENFLTQRSNPCLLHLLHHWAT